VSVTDWQFELAGVTFGRGTDYRVSELTLPKPETRHVDVDAPRADGIRFGRDQLAGSLIAFELNVVGTDATDVLGKVATLRRAWYGDDTRAVSGVSIPLRMKRPGRDAVRAYGRPRRFEPATMANAVLGHVPVVCDFQAVDPYFYGDVLESTSVTLVPPPVGGLIEPLTDPLIGTQYGQVQGHIQVGGDSPAWLVTRIDGPILDPTIEVVGQWSAPMRLSLTTDEWVDVDPQLWSRRVRRNGKQNEAGAFTASSQRLSQMRVPPGGAEVVLRGTDATGTASALFSWHTAHSSY
jgi:hypothetical protein